MTTPTVTSSTDSQMHNNIMAASSRDRPSMLATGRYPQWRSRFLRYIDTRPNGDALRKCILSGPYKPTTILVQAVVATDDSLAIPEHITVETPMNMSPENKAHIQAEKEAIHLILTGIGDEIYSTVDTCQTAQAMCKAIERLQQGESLNIQDIYKPTNNNLRTSSNSRNKNVDTTPRYKNDNQSRQFRNQRTVNVVRARENVGSSVVQQSGIQCFNYKDFGHFAKECRKPKRVKDFAYHKEKMLMCKQAKQGVPLQAEQYDWLADTDEEIDEQELEAHYSYIAKIQEVSTADSGIDSEPLEQNDQNDVESDDERVVLANLIANLKLDTEFEKYKAFNDRTVDYDKIKHLKAQLQDKNTNISMLKKLIEKGKGKSMDTKFDKPSVVRKPNAQRIPKPSFLGKPAPFPNSLKRIYFATTKSVPKTNVFEGLSKPVTAQTLPHTSRQAVSNTNVLKQGMYRINYRSTQTRAPQSPQNVRDTNPHMSTSTRVNHKSNVSRPQHKSNQLKDKVVPNNSQVKLKKTKVEVHSRILSVSNKMKYVTACKDSLNSRTLNDNAVCATCKKCLVDSNHFACVTKILNDMNARTKKPNAVPISTKKPKSHANKSIATPHKQKNCIKINQ
nr:hypothetical protein [Tanacetum cinerariifolium]